MHVLKEGGVRERGLFLSFRSLPSPFDFFPRKRLILRLERQSRKGSGEEKGTIFATIPPPPTPTKEAKNRWANTAYVLYPKYAWEQERMILMGRNGLGQERMIILPCEGKNRILDQILLYEPFFTQLAWEWLKKRFPSLKT